MTTENGESLRTTIAGQHSRLRALFAEATGADDEERGVRFADLARYLAIHDAATQTYLPHPEGDPSAASSMVSRLETIGPGDPYFLIQLGLLEESVEERARRLERDELPVLESGLAPRALIAAREGLERVDDLYADRGSGAAVPVDGGYAAQYEAARVALGAQTQGAGHSAHEQD